MSAPTAPYNMAFVSPIIDHTKNTGTNVASSLKAMDMIEGGHSQVNTSWFGMVWW